MEDSIKLIITERTPSGETMTRKISIQPKASLMVLDSRTNTGVSVKADVLRTPDDDDVKASFRVGTICAAIEDTSEVEIDNAWNYRGANILNCVVLGDNDKYDFVIDPKAGMASMTLPAVNIAEQIEKLKNNDDD